MKGWMARALDGVFGFFGRIALGRGRRSPNTLASLSHYRGRDPDSLFPEPGGLPDVTEIRRWRLGRFECSHLAFPSLHRPLAPDHAERYGAEYQLNDRVHVRWVRHRGGDPRRPTMVLLHSWMQPDSAVEEVTLLPWLASRLGVHVARMQLPFHGRRRPESSRFDGDVFWTADLVRTWEAIRQSVLDARTVRAVLAERGDGPIGFAGMSLGGMMALALACVEGRADFSMSVAAHLDLAGVLEDAPVLARMRRELREYGWGPAEVDAYIAEVGMKDMTPRIPTERILFVAGEHDRFLHADRTHALWKRWGEPPIHWFPGGHLGIFTHVSETTAAMRRHLERIGLVAPAAALARA